MTEVSTLFTVGVFQDATWAEKGIQALKAAGFTPEALSVVGKDSPDVAAVAERAFGRAVPVVQVKGIGAVHAHGPLVTALDGADRGLSTLGIAACANRVGFQAHDGRIFEALTERGGVLVAIAGAARAADALALLHSYGGGNASIGAWGGRV